MLYEPFRLPDFPMGSGVPRILHQHYLAGADAIPLEIRGIRDALLAANPGWEGRFWDAARAEAFIRSVYGEAVLSRYLSIRPEYYAARSDLLRYLALYAEGGVYLDIKSTCDRALDEAVRPDDRFLLMHFPERMRDVQTPETKAIIRRYHLELIDFPDGEYVQWVIASAPGHPYLRRVITRVLRNIGNYSPLTYGVGGAATLRVTGPIAYSLAIEEVRAGFPHAGPMSASDRGFRYSGLGSDTAHYALGRGQAYYGRLSHPLTKTGPATAALLAVIRPVARLPQIGPLTRRIRAFLVRRPT